MRMGRDRRETLMRRMNMDAKEAAKISDRAKALRIIAGYVANIKSAAEQGGRKVGFGVLDAEIRDAFKALGYTIHNEASGTIIEW